MVCQLPSRQIGSLLILLVLAGLWPVVARASGENEAPGQETSRVDAKRLFDEGTALYDRGAYDAAIERFREAHRVWPDPLVIFAVAQAQRLKGDCPAAIESYERFIKTAESSPVRTEADQYVSELKRKCPTTEPAPVPRAVRTADVSAPMLQSVPAPSARLEVKATDTKLPTRLQAITAAGGVLLGGLGFGTYLWNTSREDRWRANEAWLGSQAAATASASETQRRQQANDDLSGSIRTYDQVAITLVVAGAAALATATVLYLLGDRRPGYR
jgi:tetratricopeptide (TPR) repeat protein